MLPPPPFVLLDDARDGAAPARLYARPVAVLEADTPAAVHGVLEEIRRSVGEPGRHAAGFLSYEAAGAFEPRAALAGRAAPLAWFGLFDGYAEVDAAALLPDAAGGWAGAPEPQVSRDDYDAMFARVQALIAAGDLYQANLTFRTRVPVAGDPLALYAGLRRATGAGWAAVVHTGRDLLLSLSPELFFALDGDRLTCRPMKGTARRQADPHADAAAARALAADPKQRAENLMIVDLMRNDLSRVSRPGTVAVPKLFDVERYPTVHQMTSTVTARLAGGRDAVDVLAALFPCGSITGAPKLRAVAALDAIEHDARGVYTGAIGRIDSRDDAMFNVAIRTLAIRGQEATMGLGGGIVADSTADAEWDEALAKGGFVAHAQRPLDLIETMAFDPMEGVLRVEPHLERMKASAAALGFAFDRHGARNELQAATFRLRTAARVRLVLSRAGTVAIEVSPLPVSPAVMRVALAPLPVPPTDLRLHHKTSDRAFYDAARIAAGTDEVVFVRSDGALTEGSITSLFVDRDGLLLTPPLTDGLLPGVLRGELIGAGRAREERLTARDLGDGFLLGNALRGLVPARLI